MSAIPDRPLVTFALIAYNQEKYIRDAILSALAQTYEPLEFIFSDDCSTDDTFEIIQSMVGEFREKSRVRVNKNSKNLGLLEHINKVVSLASGEIVVMAAGDDISAMERAAVIVDYFAGNPEKFAVHSGYRCISEEGAIVLSYNRQKTDEKCDAFEILYNGGGVGVGATYAYRRKCFVWPERLPASLLNEDRILPWRAYLLGGVGFLRGDLVDYRLTQKGLSRDVSLPRWPAKRNQRHLNYLLEMTDSEQVHAIHSPNKIKLYRGLLQSIISNIRLTDYLEKKLGLFGRICCAMIKLKSKIIFTAQNKIQS